MATGSAVAATDVVIIGGGPVGLMLAAELRLGGIEPVLLERLDAASPVPKGNGLVGQIVPLLDYRGLLEPCRAEGTWAGPAARFQFGSVDLDLSRLGVSPLHVLGIPQRRLEHVLAERLRESGGSVRRGHELISFTSTEDFVTVDVRGPDGDYRIRTRYLVGCDGAHSRVRKQAGIGFPGVTSGEISRIGRVTLPAELIVPETGEVDVPGYGRLRPTTRTRTPRGAFSIAPLAMLDKAAESGVYIVSTSEQSPQDQNRERERDPGWFDPAEPMTLAELSGSVSRVLGAELPMSRPLWLTRTIGNSRQAERYKSGRVLLAGDAAHLFGFGGSLNAGLLDAVNLGWKLAATVRGSAPAEVLESYHGERHAAGRRTLVSSRAQHLLSGPGEGAEALRELVGELVEYQEPLRHLGELIQGSDFRYRTGPDGGAGPGHPLQGRPAPDLGVETSDGTTRIAELMRAARPVLLDLSGNGGAQAAGWRDRVTIVDGRASAGQAPFGAALIRPDGYVAWASSPAEADQGEAGRATTNPADGLRETLEFWFGPPTSA
jgi:2-polyprenyl-6-methoxyphenol hydroxylase-like FAD-dependent oxidoreductase